MKKLIAIACIFGLASMTQANLVTTQTDTDGVGATVDGTIGVNEYGTGNSYSYAGNANTGFGGALGNATMYMNSDANNLYIGFSGLGVAGDGNQVLIYLHTRAGGFQPDGAGMDDGETGATNPGDAARRNSSILTSDGAGLDGTDQESLGIVPDFTLAFNNRAGGSGGFAAAFELQGAGSAHNFFGSVAAGLGTATPEFSLSMASLGITGATDIDFEVFYISDTGFMSDEAIPGQSSTGGGADLSGNPGNGTGTGAISYDDFNRFQAVPEPTSAMLIGLAALFGARFIRRKN